MENIHLIKTDKPSRLYKFADKLYLNTIQKDYYQKFHLYITNDEVIKDGDWMIRDNEQPIKVTKDFFWDFGVKYYKIILTTDQDLNGIEAIDDEFLEWFVKNSSCERVEIRYTVDFNSKAVIIIPKEEPKQFKCRGMLHYSGKIIGGEHKQETLEEAAERLFPVFNRSTPFGSKYPWTPQKEREAFKRGAKWQETNLDIKDNKIELLEEDLECIRIYLDDLKIPRNDKDGNKYSIVGRIKRLQERMYSEEEVIDLLQEVDDLESRLEGKIAIRKWFTQFKKK